MGGSAISGNSLILVWFNKTIFLYLFSKNILFCLFLYFISKIMAAKRFLTRKSTMFRKLIVCVQYCKANRAVQFLAKRKLQLNQIKSEFEVYPNNQPNQVLNYDYT